MFKCNQLFNKENHANLTSFIMSCGSDESSLKAIIDPICLHNLKITSYFIKLCLIDLVIKFSITLFATFVVSTMHE